MEISISTVLHAEAITLYKALSEGYTRVQAVGITSDHEDQIKPLCGACRQLYLSSQKVYGQLIHRSFDVISSVIL
ncbi:MAG: hypothetical protein ACRD8W_31715 [Nitrososphaeraceae archaeon]